MSLVDEPTERSPLVRNVGGSSVGESSSIADSATIEVETEHKAICSPSNIFLVEPIYTLYMFCLMCCAQMLPQYIYKRLYAHYKVPMPSFNDTCKFHDVTEHHSLIYDKIENDMANYNIGVIVMFMLPGLIVMPLAGPLSDVIGRKPFITIPVLGSSVTYAVLTMMIYCQWPLELLYACIVLLSFTGGMAVMPTMAMIYIADTTTYEQRTVRLIVIEIANLLGTSSAQLATGYAITYMGFQSLTAICFLISACTFFYSVFLPESLNKKRTASNQRIDKQRCLENFRGFRVFFSPGINNRRAKLFLCVITLGLLAFAENGTLPVLSYYLLDPPFCWTAENIGLFNALTQCVQLLTAGFISRVLTGRVSDSILLVVCCLSAAIHSFVLAFAYKTWMAYAAILLGMAGVTTYPLLRSYCSRLVHKTEQATVLSGLMTVQLACTFAGSIFSSAVYAATARAFHGAIFTIAGAAVSLGLMLVMILVRMNSG